MSTEEPLPSVHLYPSQWSYLMNLVLGEMRAKSSLTAAEIADELLDQLMPDTIVICEKCGQYTDVEEGIQCDACQNPYHLKCQSWHTLKTKDDCYCDDCIDNGNARKHANKEWPYDYD